MCPLPVTFMASIVQAVNTRIAIIFTDFKYCFFVITVHAILQSATISQRKTFSDLLDVEMK